MPLASARTPSDVGHPNGEAFALDVMVLREFPADKLVINVAVDGKEGGNVRRASVTARLPMSPACQISSHPAR